LLSSLIVKSGRHLTGEARNVNGEKGPDDWRAADRFRLSNAVPFRAGSGAVKFLKLMVALWLLPACVALTMSVFGLAHRLVFEPQPMTVLHSPLAAFCTGYGLWLVVFTFLPKPMRTYVLGHELTHAVWALLMGARVSGLRVKKTGGQVRTSKTNWLITLAPYFFPFYAVLFIALFFIAHAIWDLSAHMYWLFFLAGLGWSFHVTFTLMMLLTTKQPDVQSQGVVFSLVIVYLMNLLTLTLTATLLSRTLSLADLAREAGRDCVVTYSWTLDKFLALCHYAFTLFRHGR